VDKYKLRDRYKKETGKKYNVVIYDKKNNANTFFPSWDYVAWIESLLMQSIELFLRDKKD
jgi:hypothetical protein